MYDSNNNNDAPGFSTSENGNEGPICWKCVGKGVLNKKRKLLVDCNVCSTTGRLPRKTLETKKCRPDTNRHPRRTYLDAPGPSPIGSVTLHQPEELCSLVGRWKVQCGDIGKDTY